MRLALLIVVACLPLASGCYTTTYYNLSREPHAEPSHLGTEPDNHQYWRHFWVYGWGPDVLRIDAAAACGGIEHVERLETERTFLQGLIAAFAGYYINIYSPYSARVVCDHSSDR